MEKTYIAIDLKSFYASVECAKRGHNPMTTHLVVADASRTDKTICLAVSPSLKALGIPGRPRLFEVKSKVENANRGRLARAIRLGKAQKRPDGSFYLPRESSDEQELKADPGAAISFITAVPRMQLYEEYSTKIVGIYLSYVSAEDIHVYSIDECFIDVTSYLCVYKKSAAELAMTMIRDVYEQTGITATAGIGSNLYLAKVAMDIVAKHAPADENGVRMAQLTERSYRELLWDHRPLTDFWRVGKGYSAKLTAMGLHTMGDIARASLDPCREDALYKAFGVNAELLIDHAWGFEPTDIETIRAYRPRHSSLSSGQVLMEGTDYETCRIIVREMTEALVLALVRKGLVTRQLVLTVGYDRENLTGERGKRYQGPVSTDFYGRRVPAHAHGTANLDGYSSSTSKIMEAVMDLYSRIMNPDLLSRRITLVAAGLIPETEIPAPQPEQLSLFVDYEALEKARRAENERLEKERSLQEAVLNLQSRFGKTAVIKGTSLQKGATGIQRAHQIGGHKA